LLKAHLKRPLNVWPGFDLSQTPFAIYDEDNVVFVNHPSPPDKPPALNAATDMEIGGVLTAVVPAAHVKDEAELIPLAYHEAFHVYQNTGNFAPVPGFNFFTALAFYPELDADYLALCLLEERLFNDPQLSLELKAAALATTSRKRIEVLSRNEDAHLLENYSERFEGTASYVEHHVAREVLSKPYPPVSGGSSRVRAYRAGAALGRLLDALGADWKRRIQEGATPSDVLIGAFLDDVNLKPYGLSRMLEQARAKVNELREAVETELSRAFSAGAVTLAIPPQTTVYRSFNPQRITSLGNGQVVYRGLRLDFDCGYIQLSDEVPLLEDVRTGTLLFPARQVRFEGSRLMADGPDIHANLSQVSEEGKNNYRLTCN